MIRLENVVKTYPQGPTKVDALRGVSLEVQPGEFVSVVGPSGSGKSTMLHLVAGLDDPDSGSIWVAEQRLGDLSDDALTVLRRRRIGIVFQFFNLLPMLSARENVALPLLLDRRRRQEVLPAADELLERVGLSDRRDHRPDALSGGEMQRVAIARALVIEPAIVLADEPTGNLDSGTAEIILELLRDTAKERGRSVLMITHDARAAAYGDRVVTLHDGRITEDVRSPVLAARAG